MYIRKLTTIAVSAVVALTLSGCGGSDEPLNEITVNPQTAQQPFTSSPEPGATLTSYPAYDPSAVVPEEEKTGDASFGENDAYDEWDVPELTSTPMERPVESTSWEPHLETFKAVFFNRDLSPEEWRTQLAPLVSDRLKEAYQDVDPTYIPSGNVVSTTTVVDGGPTFQAVEIILDSGMTMTVELQPAGNGWQVTRVS